MQKRIFSFIKKKYLCTLCCCENGLPWANAFFYVFDEPNRRLIYVTSEQTHHAQIMKNNQNIAGTIFSPTKFSPSLQGIQFTGIATKLDGEEENLARSLYKEAYQHEIIDSLSVWQVSLEYVRMIDHTLGFMNVVEWRHDCDYDTVSDYVPFF